jgi:glycosyltransferase involved in cell wall biosynthesis
VSLPDIKPRTAMLHYSAPPVIGGVEGVIQAHCQVFRQFDYPVAVITGQGEPSALVEGTDLHQIPELDTQHPKVLEMNAVLERGEIPDTFEPFTQQLTRTLGPILEQYDNLIVHNVFTKHFNLPLTAALFQLIESGVIRNCIAWCHDFTWTSPNSRSKVYAGYPWDLLRTYDPRMYYVTVSRERRQSLAQLFHQPESVIKVIYNGVDPHTLLGFSSEGIALIRRLGLLDAELVLIMPVRVTTAKNIEYALELLAALKLAGIHPKLILTGPPDPHSDQSMAYFRELQGRRHELGLDQEMRFVFESGPQSDKPYQIDLNVVGDLYRTSDVMFMPSHREGFGMPVLEAGLVGIPAICTPAVPAAVEIGAEQVTIFDPGMEPARLAGQLIDWMQTDPQYRFRRRVRRQYTWEAIFKREILPLLQGTP